MKEWTTNIGKRIKAKVKNGNKFIRYLFNYMTILNINSLNTPMKKDIIRVNSERGVKYIFPPKHPL